MYAVVDVECTGGSPAVDRITEIAIIIFDGKTIIEEFSTLVNPERPIDPWVSKLTGISQSMVKAAPTFKEIHQKVLQLLSGKIFTAHNVKFDFGMVRKEFKRIDIDFTSKQLDTVSFSRRVLTGLSSYSLGKLCDKMGIKIENRHRALGDAVATVQLLELLLATDIDLKILDIELHDGLDTSKLPPQINHSIIEALPDEAGIFYFKDEDGKTLWSDGSKSIRKKVIQEFSEIDSNSKKGSLLNQISTIDYELSGTVLIAKLMMLEEARKQSALPQKNIREIPPAFGIYIIEDKEKVKYLRVLALDNSLPEPALKFITKNSAVRVLQKITEVNNLNGHYTMLNLLKGKKEDTTLLTNALNEKIETSVNRYLFRSPNFFIVDEGVHPDENSVVWVENNEYRGIGFFFKENMEVSVENLKSIIKPAKHSAQAQKLIRQHLRKTKMQGMISY